MLSPCSSAPPWPLFSALSPPLPRLANHLSQLGPWCANCWVYHAHPKTHHYDPSASAQISHGTSVCTSGHQSTNHAVHARNTSQALEASPPNAVRQSSSRTLSASHPKAAVGVTEAVRRTALFQLSPQNCRSFQDDWAMK